ncbi:MAG: hypothetical protein ACKV0T_07635 [Planctomycetales bacterium]
MLLHELLGRLLKLDGVQSIDQVEWSLAAGWAQVHPTRVVWLCLLAAAGTALFYHRWQPRRSARLRWGLTLLRTSALSLLIVCLADPVLLVRLSQAQRPWLWLLFDGTDSMSIRDEYPAAEAQRLAEATGLGAADRSSAAERPTRAELVQGFLRKQEGNLPRELARSFRLRAFELSPPGAVRELGAGAEAGEVDPERWASELSTEGQVTPLGRAFEELALRRPPGQLAGLLVFSDFDQNSGPTPLAAAQRLGTPLFTVGVGARTATDVSLALQAPLLLKKGERSTLMVTVQGSDTGTATIPVRLTARRMSDGGPNTGGEEPLLIGSQSVTLGNGEQAAEFSWVPTETGRYILSAQADALAGELVTENNRAEREVAVRDDFIRVLYVEYEPTWEWRFIKEVFHRDKLVGMRGFRTFLRSADNRVRQTNELFAPQLTPRRAEFFANDVIFLGDMPAGVLTSRFCEMTEEFVGKFGGGLVVLGGPHFGPGQLASTGLAKMLPVEIDRSAKARDKTPFRLQLTPESAAYDFMKLGGDDQENTRAWNNLGLLPWYQPVTRLHPLATSLAVHPHDLCADGRTPQPLIAVRRYGKGEVVYLGFNETWRLRRKYGELYYRQFWGQMIHRLGLSHALGSQKRFVVRTDRQHYQPDDKVLLTVEAFDANFEPLTEEDLPERALAAEWSLPTTGGGPADPQPLRLPQLREGVFEVSFPATLAGEHKVTVHDPVTGDRIETLFQVASVSLERRSAVRNVPLQEQLARETGGASYDLTTVSQFSREFQPEVRRERTLKVISLWDTWLSWGLVVGLLLGEWTLRKRVYLP